MADLELSEPKEEVKTVQNLEQTLDSLCPAFAIGLGLIRNFSTSKTDPSRLIFNYVFVAFFMVMMSSFEGPLSPDKTDKEMQITSVGSGIDRETADREV